MRIAFSMPKFLISILNILTLTHVNIVKLYKNKKEKLPRLYTRATSNCSVDLIAHVQTPLAFEPFLNFVIRKEKRRITAHDSQ